MARMALVGIIHNRCLAIKDGVFDESAAVSLMSNDADGAAYSEGLFHEVWSQVLELCIGMYMLAGELGWVCIFPLLIVLCKSTFYVEFHRSTCHAKLTPLSCLTVGRVDHRKSRRSANVIQYGDPDAHLNNQSHTGLYQEH
jgi:hypothetical protein